MSEQEQEPEDDGFAPEEWVYLGQCRLQGGGTGHEWRTPDGKPVVYAKLKARVLGGVYQLNVRRTDERVTVQPGTLSYSGHQVEDAAAIQLIGMEAERKIKVKRLEANTSRTAQLDEALAPLLELARGLKTYSDRRALLDYVASKVANA
jgi:hypothetical protein